LEAAVKKAAPHFTPRMIWLMSLAMFALMACSAAFYWFGPTRGLPYSDLFGANRQEEWRAYGGIWELRNGGMRNDSDERGAKLITGSSRWTDYALEADVRFLGQGGDVGLMVRSSQEELGVDAYDGYYVGLRKGDDSIVIGRADHGWMEGKAVPVPGGVHTLEWFHLKVIAEGCRIAASAVNLASGQVAYGAMEEHPCVGSGRIGLRSLNTGGEWRNVRVTRATASDMSEICSRVREITEPMYPRTEAASNNRYSAARLDDTAQPAAKSREMYKKDPEPVNNMALLKEATAKRVSIRGVVVMTSPTLYVQDGSAGVAVVAQNVPLLNLGDEVEVTGQPQLRDYSVVIRDAQVRLLWDRAPLPPLSVTTAQAATGAVDAMLVETQGTIVKTSRDAESIILDLDDGAQSYRAIVSSGNTNVLYRHLVPHSLVRLRGICVLDPKYTHRLTPFVLLMRSANDISIIAGPPWWTTGHIVLVACIVLLLTFSAQLLYGRIERWRLRAIAQERVRLSHELHDTLAQSFAGLGFQLQGIRKGLRNAPANLNLIERQLDAACDIVRSTHEEASLSIAMLREDSPEVGDLAVALERCASQIVFGGSVSIDVRSTGQVRAVPLRITDALFHVGREAIVNAVRHGNPTQITVGIEYAASMITMLVEDNGTGFERVQGIRGLGLRGMERRASAIDAHLSISSKTGEGSRVTIAAPLSEPQAYVAYFNGIWNRIKRARSHRGSKSERFAVSHD
jgi:signal transduction histidine kinase